MHGVGSVALKRLSPRSLARGVSVWLRASDGLPLWSIVSALQNHYVRGLKHAEFFKLFLQRKQVASPPLIVVVTFDASKDEIECYLPCPD